MLLSRVCQSCTRQLISTTNSPSSRISSFHPHFLNSHLINRPSTSSAFRYFGSAAAKKGADPTKRKDTFKDLRRLFSYAYPIRWRLAAGVCLLCISSSVSISVPYFLGRVMDIAATDAGPSQVDANTSNSPLSHSSSGFGGFFKFGGSSKPTISSGDSELLTDDSTIKDNEGEKANNSAIGEQITTGLGKYCLLLTGVFILGATANFGRAYLMLTASQIITNRLRQATYNSIIRQEIAFFDRNKTGELVNRLSNDATIVGHSISMNLSNGLRSLFGATGSACMMVYVSPQLSLVGVVVLPLVAGMGILYGNRLQKLTAQMNDALAGATQVAEERISGVRTVRAFAAELKEQQRYGERIQQVLSVASKDALARAGFFGLMGFNGNIMMLSILYAGGHMITMGTLSPGSLTSFLVYAIYIVVSTEGLSGFYTELLRGLASGRLLFQLAERQPLVPVTGGRQLGQLRGHISFTDVRFSYAQARLLSEKLDASLSIAPSTLKNPPTTTKGNDKVTENSSTIAGKSAAQSNSEADEEGWILDGFTLSMPPGTTTALVGASGSGKSTVGSMLLRLFDPAAGDVRIDGENITDLDPTWLRRQFGVVSQEPTLFSTSVRDNITYGSPDPSSIKDDQIFWALQQAHALQFIEDLPQGLDTVIGERGSTLSGGQRQRLAIARALIHDPKIMILDEATSALDADSEHQVRLALEHLMKKHNRTVLVIAHRLSTIRNADQIAVLKHGTVAEIGTYSQLLQRPEGLFRQLINKQAVE